MSEAVHDINRYIKYTNVSISPWYFTKVEQKYFNGEPARIGPDYYSAVTDKLFFDIDCLTPEGEIVDAAISSKDKLWQWAVNAGYRRECAFTSGGYQILIGCVCSPSIYQAVVADIHKRFNLTVDELVLLQSMRRMPGSFNFGKPGKSLRHTFCIDLKEDEVFQSFSFHRELAKTQRIGFLEFGTELYKPQGNFKQREKPKVLVPNANYKQSDNANEILEQYGYTMSELCPNIVSIIKQPHVSHEERLIIIKYLKDIILMKYDDVVAILPMLLTAKHGNTTEGYHSAYEELQPQAVFNNGHFNPNYCKQKGYCPTDCQECSNFLKGMKTI
jgi:hypothetical protein